MVTGSGEKLRSSRSAEQDPASISLIGPQKLYTFDKLVTFSNVGAAVEFGSALIAPLPRADLIVVGGYLHLDVFENTPQANIIDAFVLSYSLGTVATVNNSLADATDFDLKTAATLAAASGGVAPHSQGVLDGARVLASGGATNYLNNNAGALGVFLNLTLPDASISGVGSLRCRGSLRLVTLALGKNS